MESILSVNAPDAIGPYSQAIKANGWVFCSGQIPLNKDGTLVAGDIIAQTTKVLENLKAVLVAAGSSMDKVVKTTVFLKDMNDFVRMNETYAKFFGDHRPARATVQVARLPKEVFIEIDAIALA